MTLCHILPVRRGWVNTCIHISIVYMVVSFGVFFTQDSIEYRELLNSCCTWLCPIHGSQSGTRNLDQSWSGINGNERELRTLQISRCGASSIWLPNSYRLVTKYTQLHGCALESQELSWLIFEIGVLSKIILFLCDVVHSLYFFWLIKSVLYYQLVGFIYKFRSRGNLQFQLQSNILESNFFDLGIFVQSK